MKRTVRPSRFQLEDTSEEPRPSYRKLSFVNPFQLEAPGALPFAPSLPVPICSSSQHKPLAIAPLSQSLRGHSSSLRESEALVHQALVQSWIAVAEAVEFYFCKQGCFNISSTFISMEALV